MRLHQHWGMAKQPNKKEISFPERLKRLAKAGLQTTQLRGRMRSEDRTLGTLEARVNRIQEFVKNWQDPKNKGMLYFVMYDIEDHRIRRNIAKYLIREGCTRIQKSVFMGNNSHAKYREMADTLEEINQMYQNSDSIVILPVTRESITQLEVVGKDLQYKMVVQPPNVLII
jgi:CRISPR-associated protein Cas2